MILFHIIDPSRNINPRPVVIVTATGRDYAKSKASQFIGGDPDNYIVTPLTQAGDYIHFDISIKP